MDHLTITRPTGTKRDGRMLAPDRATWHKEGWMSAGGAMVMVVDDDASVREALTRTLEKVGYRTVAACSGREVLSRIESTAVDAIVMDVNMPAPNGLETLHALRERGITLPVIVMSGAGSIQVAVSAVQQGATDFIEKPVRRERLVTSLENALRISGLQARYQALEAATVGDDEIVGDASPVQELRRLIGRTAPTEARVLITGENGTGKELIARALHRGSPRSERSFIKLNSAAVPSDLIESELFGHEKGAFTGAVANRTGKFELADGGTLFLDEIGDMPLAMQSKLLRVLQEGEFEPVGGNRTRKVDVRVVAATNRDLHEMIAEGTFREDLYYRLAVVEIRSPPLRERKADIPALVARFLGTVSRVGTRERRMGPEGLAALASYEYPGNVRELRNIVERLAILSENDEIDAEDVRRVLLNGRSVERSDALYRSGVALRDLLADAERRIIEEALTENEGNMAAAARALDLERSHLYKKVKALGIERS